MTEMIVQGNLARDGWEFHRRGDAPPVQRCQVMGERASGTNFLRELVVRNIAVRHVEDYGWKHGFISFPAIRREDMLIVCFREAQDWLRSLYRKPWHVPRDRHNIGFSDFLRTSFETFRDMPLGSGDISGQGLWHMPNQQDRDPFTGLAYDNPILLRNAKNRSFLSLRQRQCNVCFLRYEAVDADPAAFIRAVSGFFDIEFQPDLDLPQEALGSFGRKPEGAKRDADPQFTTADLDYLRDSLDASIEMELGYPPVGG